MKKKILISGGGIAGVSLAVFLKDSGFDITLIERAPEWRTVGYAIGMWRPGLDILVSLGANKDFWEKTYIIDKGAVLNKKDKVLVGFPFQTDPPIARTMLREDLHAFLRSKLPNDLDVRFNTTIQKIENKKDEVRVQFSDDTWEKFDLVVAADGARSSTRDLVFHNSIHQYGWAGWATWESTKLSHFDGYYLTSEPGWFFLSLPHKNRATVGFMHTIENFDPKTYRKENLWQNFSSNPFLQKHIHSAINQENIFCDEMVFVKQKEWFKDRVVVTGDAKHCVSPISGFGTTLAMEDAQTLADELQKNDSIDTTLQNFAKRRTKEINRTQTVIKIMEKSVMIKNPVIIKIRNLFAKFIPGNLFSKWLVSVFR